MEMLADIGKDTVDFMPNFDETEKEPTVLPARFPNLLVNGTSGIAVGMATNIPPHNLREVIAAVVKIIDNRIQEGRETTVEELMEIIQGPDFPTGAQIIGHRGIEQAYRTGRGKLRVRSVCRIEPMDNGKNMIIVSEIPYLVNKQRLIEKIADLHKDKKVDGMTAIRDETTSREGTRIVIELRRDVNPNVVLNQLYRHSQLEDTYGVIMLALVNGIPRELSLKQILELYLEHQVDVVQRACRYDLRKARERAHILQGFLVALDFIDEVVAILRSSKTIPEGKQRLMERFAEVDLTTLMEDPAYRAAMGMAVDPSEKEYPTIGLSEAQADAIVSMRLGQLTGLERDKILNEVMSLCDKINDLRDILAHKERQLGIIRDDLEEIRGKYGDERRTEIENVSGEMDIEDLIPVEDCVVTYTNFGYIKRVPLSVYKSQKRGGRGVTGMKQREEDFASEMFVASSHDHVLFFTNRGIMFDLKCYEIPMGGKDSKGTNIVNLLPLMENEKIAAMMKVSEFNDESYIVMVTKNGKIKRTALPAYKNVRKNGIIAIKLEEGDEIAGVRMTNGKDQLIVATKNGMAIRCDENCIRPQGRSAHGVRIMKLREGDEIVSMARVRAGASLLTVTEKGFGKRADIESYPLRNRGGFGITNYKPDDERGKVCGIKVVDESDDIILISSDGIIIRIRTSDIRMMGRIAKGVRVMRVSETGRVVAFTRTEHEEDAEMSEVEQLSEEELAAQEQEAKAAETAEAAVPEEPAESDDAEEAEEES
jgi:DNA gyrase subunit A